MNDVRYWQQVFTATTKGAHARNFCMSVQKHCCERGKVQNKTKSICKAKVNLEDREHKNYTVNSYFSLNVLKILLGIFSYCVWQT